MTRATLPAAVFAFFWPLLCTHGDDGPVQAKKPQSLPDVKAEPKKGDVAPGSRDRLQDILRAALKQIRSMDEAAAKSRSELDPLSSARMAMATSPGLQAKTIATIGRAQAKLGDLAGARATWQLAIDSAGENNFLNTPIERGALYIEIAKAQNEAGEQNEARFTLRQALQVARSIKAESMLPFEVPGGVTFDNDSLAKKAEFFRRIAQVQADAGERSAAQETFRLAVDTAESIKSPTNKVRALLEIAQTGWSDEAKAVWDKALDFALSQKDEFGRAKATELVIRARLKALPTDETLTLIADRFHGDFQHYALWIVADEIADGDKTVPPKAMDRLCQLAQKAKFDRPSKKIKVFQRIAEAQARLGDYDGAYRTAGEPHPVNDIQTFRATQARANVMKAIAAAQLKAKQRDAARETVLNAIEMFAPLPEEDAEAYFPLAELCTLQAKAGDLSGALQTLGAVSSSAQKVAILAGIAVGHAEAGRQDDARKTIRMAFDVAGRAPNDYLWSVASEPGSMGWAAEGLDPMFSVLQVLAAAQARIGDLDEAVKTLASISSSAMGKYMRNQAIAQTFEARLDARDVAGAWRFAELMPDDENPYMTEKSALLERVATVQAEKEDPAGVLERAEKLKAPGSRLFVLRGLAAGIAQRVTPPETTAAGTTAKPGTPK